MVVETKRRYGRFHDKQMLVELVVIKRKVVAFVELAVFVALSALLMPHNSFEIKPLISIVFSRSSVLISYIFYLKWMLE